MERNIISLQPVVVGIRRARVTGCPGWRPRGKNRKTSRAKRYSDIIMKACENYYYTRSKPGHQNDRKTHLPVSDITVTPVNVV